MLLPQFKVAWNIEKIDEVVDLYHPDSPIRKAHESGRKMRGVTVAEALAKAKEKFGAIKEIKIEKHLAKGSRYSAQTTFDKAGALHSVFTLKKGLIKTDQGWEPRWFFSDVQFIDRHTPKMR